MLNQNAITEKLQELRGSFKTLWEKFNYKAKENTSLENYEFTPDTPVSTSPRTTVPLSDGSADAQKLVWDNEDASMQDKSYSFDEVTTDEHYEYGDDFEPDEDKEISSGRYS